MGKALIFKGADFSGNSIGTLENVTVTNLGTGKSYWSNATSSINEGSFGFLNSTNGFMTSINILTNSELTFDIIIYRDGSEFKAVEGLATTNVAKAESTLSFSPVEVKSGDYIGVRFLTSNKGLYKISGGDVDTYTMGRNPPLQDSNDRIYPWNFKIVSI